MKNTLDEGKKMQENKKERIHFAVILDNEVVTTFSFQNNEASEQYIAIYSSNPTIALVEEPPALGSKWN